VVSIDGTKIAANAARSANRSADWVREEAQRIAREILDEAAVTDTAEDHAAAARSGGSDDDLPPEFATRSGRAANIQKALAELDRQDTEHAEADAVDQARVAGLLAGLEAGEFRQGPPPAGVDPVVWHQARIAGITKLLDALEGIRGREASHRRKDLRERLKRAQRTLAQAQQAAGADAVDLRGRAARVRDRRTARARARGALGDPVNTSDPDSRLMTEGSGGGAVQGYNAQVAVTDDHLILGIHVSQDANDTHCLLPTLAAATQAAGMLGLDIESVLADSGYFTRENITTDGPDRLIAPGKNRDVAAEARENPTTGPPPEDIDPLEAMRHRLREPENAATYKRRSATVEPVIAHLKDQVGLRRFARRGLQAVTAELNLAAAVVNLNRLHQAAHNTG
jgi:hypothetical protein